MACSPSLVLFLLMASAVLRPATSEKCDIVFCLDSSDSMTNVYTNPAKEAIIAWTKAWKVDPDNGARVGVILFSARTQTLFSLTDALTESQIIEKVNAYTKRLDRSTALDKCLTYSNTKNNGFFLDSQRQAKQYMVIITNGNSDSVSSTKDALQALRGNGVSVVSIALGADVKYDDANELKDAGSDYFYRVLQYRNLAEKINIRDKICPALCGGTAYDPTTKQCCNGNVIDKNANCQTSPSTSGPCQDKSWYATPHQCDAHSRCTNDGTGVATVETEGCACNQFRDDFGNCVEATTCSQDPCKDTTVTIKGWLYHSHKKSSCRMYWKCDTARKVTITDTKCCLPWEYFDVNSRKCELDIYKRCNEDCECNAKSRQIPSCKKFPDVSSINSPHYYEATFDALSNKWDLVPKKCADGKIFYNDASRNLCRCDYRNLPGIFLPEPVVAAPSTAEANTAQEQNGDNDDNGAANTAGTASSDSSDSSDTTAGTDSSASDSGASS